MKYNTEVLLVMGSSQVKDNSRLRSLGFGSKLMELIDTEQFRNSIMC